MFLCAGDPSWVPGDRGDFVRLLGEIGLIDCATSAVAIDDRFPVGQQFLGLVTFLGCSPQVIVDPRQAADGQAACFVQQYVYPHVHFVTAADGSQPRCPGCRTPVGAVETSVHDALFTCGQCGEATPVSALDWRRSAGFGRFFLEIGGVYPHEALPSDMLLNTLRDYSGSDWQYFYVG